MVEKTFTTELATTSAAVTGGVAVAAVPGLSAGFSSARSWPAQRNNVTTSAADARKGQGLKIMRTATAMDTAAPGKAGVAGAQQNFRQYRTLSVFFAHAWNEAKAAVRSSGDIFIARFSGARGTC